MAGIRKTDRPPPVRAAAVSRVGGRPSTATLVFAGRSRSVAALGTSARPGRHGAVDVPSEDHPARPSSAARWSRRCRGCVPIRLRALSIDHHRAVVEVGDALVVFLAFLEDEHVHDLARQHDRLERVGQLVDVQDLDAAELGDLVQIEVVGDDLARSSTRASSMSFMSTSLTVGKSSSEIDDLDARHLLDAMQDVEAAAAAVPLERIGGVGDELQFLQDELRHHQRAVEEARSRRCRRSGRR